MLYFNEYVSRPLSVLTMFDLSMRCTLTTQFRLIVRLFYKRLFLNRCSP